ncbi:MAG TPA: prepilin-type N-terminal cleavage/methylation domain-containing protein [Dongiaceae bacterium]|nr:prepilin-type N-terminal cleavage/methylation domain-containing protein [Dongiaceae bacterium]
MTAAGGAAPRRREAGFTMAEMAVSLAIFCLAMGGLSELLIHNSQINRTEQMRTEVQSNARNCLSMIVATLRSAGWDPRNTGLQAVVLDPLPTDSVNFIEVLADLNEDGDTDDPNERILIRHINDRIEWRTSSDTSQPYVTLAENITNDSDGDGVEEAMFVPDSLSHPTRVLVRITARSPSVDPRRGDYLRYTVSSEVVLRRNL